MSGRSPVRGLTLHDTASYTHEMLRSLEKLAVQQNQPRLAELLRAAAVEADRLEKESR